MFDLETLKANLIAKGYEVSCFDTAEEAGIIRCIGTGRRDSAQTRSVVS